MYREDEPGREEEPAGEARTITHSSSSIIATTHPPLPDKEPERGKEKRATTTTTATTGSRSSGCSSHASLKGDNDNTSSYPAARQQQAYSHGKIHHTSSSVANVIAKISVAMDHDEHPSTTAASLGSAKTSHAASPTAAITVAPLVNKIINPAPSDVLFGRGKPYQFHGGNQRLRAVVNGFKDDYAASRRYDKLALAEEIVKGIQGGRWGEPGKFLRRADHGQDYWLEAADEEAREKVSHALRGKGKKTVHTALPTGSAQKEKTAVSQETLPEAQTSQNKRDASRDTLLVQQMMASAQQERNRTELAHQFLLGRRGPSAFGADDMRRKMDEQQNLVLRSQHHHQRHIVGGATGNLLLGGHDQGQFPAGSPLRALASSTFLQGNNLLHRLPPNTIAAASSSVSNQEQNALRASPLSGFIRGRPVFTDASPLSTLQHQSSQERQLALMLSLQKQQEMQLAEEVLFGHQRNVTGSSSASAALWSSLAAQTNLASTNSVPNDANIAYRTIQQQGSLQPQRSGMNSLIQSYLRGDLPSQQQGFKQDHGKPKKEDD